MNFHFRSQSDSSDSGIIRYLDEQQSLERLFSPPSEDFVPLRNRNLPPSFFNPTDIINNNNNNSGDRHQTTFHARSASHFDQKPKLNGIHMRTQSVLAPMSSYVSTSNGSDGISNYTASSANSSLIDNNNSNHSSLHQLNVSNNNSINNLNSVPQNIDLNLNNNNQSHTIIANNNNNNNSNNTHHHHQLHYRNYSSPAYVRVGSSNFLPNQQQQSQLLSQPQSQSQQPLPQPPSLTTTTIQPTPINGLEQQVELNYVPQQTFHQRTFSLQPAPLESDVPTVDPSIQSDQLYWNSSHGEPQQYNYGW